MKFLVLIVLALVLICVKPYSEVDQFCDGKLTAGGAAELVSIQTAPCLRSVFYRFYFPYNGVTHVMVSDSWTGVFETREKPE